MRLDVVLVPDLGNGSCLMEFKGEIEGERLKDEKEKLSLMKETGNKETLSLSHKVQPRSPLAL